MMNAFEIKPYTHYRQEEILPLYESVGWSNYTRNPEMLRRAFEHSLKIYTAYQNGQPAGLIRAVGDGFSVVFVNNFRVIHNGVCNAVYKRRKAVVYKANF